MNISFEFMLMILNNQMLKLYLSGFFLNQVNFLKKLGCPRKQSRLQVDEILNFLTFFVNGHLNFIYAFLTTKVKMIIYQYFNVKIYLNTIPLINFNNTFDLLLIH
jgi:hypothetical protein